MNNEFEEYKAEFREVIQKCIDMKWITVNELISLDGVASQFAKKMSIVARHRQTNEVIGKLIWLRNFYHEDLIAILKLFKEDIK